MFPINPQSNEQLKELFFETFLNFTDKVTKFSDNSILSADAYATSVLAQKILKDAIIYTTSLFPENVQGTRLDYTAQLYGISGRFGAEKSTTYLRIKATSGTTYQTGVHIFSGNSGITFELENDITIDDNGFGYAKVRSIQTGLKANVPPLTINKVSPVPIGHEEVLNEVAAFGGIDVEDDETYRLRVQQGANILSRNTISYLEQVILTFKSNLLFAQFQGFDSNGKAVIALATKNGVSYDTNELNEIYDKTSDYLAISDLKQKNTSTYGVVYKNIEYLEIDVEYRVNLDPLINPDDYRINVQISMNNYLNSLYFKNNNRIDWDILLTIARNTEGAISITDESFLPNKDIVIEDYKVPRLKSFIIYDLEGNLISDNGGNLSPIFYENNETNTSFEATVLSI